MLTGVPQIVVAAWANSRRDIARSDPFGEAIRCRATVSESVGRKSEALARHSGTSHADGIRPLPGELRQGAPYATVGPPTRSCIPSRYDQERTRFPRTAARLTDHAKLGSDSRHDRQR